MNDIGYIINLDDIGIIIYTLKTFFISLCTYYTFLKITYHKRTSNTKLVLVTLFTFIISIICAQIKYLTDSLNSILILVLLLSGLYSINAKEKLGNCVLITTICLSINYIIFISTIVITFIPNLVLQIQNDYISLIIMIIVHTIILICIFKIKKLKFGFTFLKKNFSNEYFDILILNISVSIFLTFIILNNFDHFLTLSLFFGFISFAIIMFITIQKTFTMYYKHKLLVTELEDTKKELENREKEIKELETENLNFSKMSHSIAHKQKSLEFKLNELMLKSEISPELDINREINKLSNEYFNNNAKIELSKTGIEQLDDMLLFMQNECINNNIDFELKLSGNIYHMTNNFIDISDLEILLADHIKNAIIAINHSDNINRSILVKLGIINRYYSLYVYDSGVEFELDTLLNLGEKPSTTHSNDGGTGMGFMNTFDTLDKYKASILINEINSPCKENYTKFIAILFDKKNKYTISSYRSEKIKNLNQRKDLIIEKNQ